MKNMVIGSMAFLAYILYTNYHEFNTIDKFYAILFFLVPFIFIKYKRSILTLHLIYTFLVCTYGMMCTHKVLHISGLLCTLLWYYAQYIENSCYFLELQFNGRKMKGMFENNIFKKGYKIFIYNNILCLIKLLGFKVYKNNSLLDYVNKILTLIIGYYISHELFIINNLSNAEPLFVDKHVINHSNKYN